MATDLFNALFHSLFTRPGGHDENHDEPDDVDARNEQVLARLCAFPAHKDNGKIPTLPSKQFILISRELRRQDEIRARKTTELWSGRPRLYTVLRAIDELQLMPRFISHEIVDLGFPFDELTLPGFVKGLALRQNFLHFQQHVLSEAHDIEATQEHVHLSGSADQHYERLADLGNGTYGTVDHVRSTLSCREYARKKVARGKDSAVSRNRQSAAATEIATLKRLRHLHLVAIEGSYTDRDHIAFLMLPVAEMNLEQWLEQYPTRPNNVAVSTRFFFGCLAEAMCYLRAEGIRHRDLKPRNILVKSNRVYIADFGTALDNGPGGRSTTHNARAMGTEAFWSPEQAKRQPRGNTSEMWSLGLIYLHIITVLKGLRIREWQRHLINSARLSGTEPAAHSNTAAVAEWLKRLSKNNKVPDVNECIVWARDLLQAKPDARPSAQSLMQNILDSPFAKEFRCPDCRQPGQHNLLTSESQISDQLQEPPKHPVAKLRDREAVEQVIDSIKSSWKGMKPDPSSKKSTLIKNWLETSAPASSTNGNLGAIPSRALADFAPFLPGSFVQTPPPLSEVDEDSDGSVVSAEHRGTYDPEMGIYIQYSEDNTSASSDAQDDDNLESCGSRDSPIIHIVEDDSSDESDFSLNLTEIPDGQYDDMLTLEKIQEIDEEEDEVEVGVEVACNLDFATASLGTTVSRKPQEHTGLGIVSTHTPSSAPQNAAMTQSPESATLGFNDRSTERFDVLDAPRLSPPPDQHLCPPSGTSLGSQIACGGCDTPSSMQDQVDTTFRERTATLKRRKDSATGSVSWVSATVDRFERAKGVNPLKAVGVGQGLVGGPSSHVVGTKDVQLGPTDEPFVMLDGHVLDDEVPMVVTVDSEDKSMLKTPIFKKKSATRGRDGSMFTRYFAQPLSRNKISVKNASIRRRQNREKCEKDVASLSRLDSPPTKLSSRALMARDRQLNGTGAPTATDSDASPSFATARFIDNAWKALDTAETVATTAMDESSRKLLYGLRKYFDQDRAMLERWCKAGRPANVKDAVQNRCNPGTRRHPRPLPLVLAIKGQTQPHYKCAKALITANCDVNAVLSGTTPLLRVIQQPPYETRSRLLACILVAGHADTNKAGSDGDVPILKVFASVTNRPLEEHMIETLVLLLHPTLPKKVDVNAKHPTTGNTALHLAVRRRSPEAVAMLIHRGADVNAVNASGISPLLVAANQWEGELEDEQAMILEYLLDDDDTDVNAKAGSPNASALHQAVRAGAALAVEILLERRADPDLVDNEGCTPRDWLDRHHPDKKSAIHVMLRVLLNASVEVDQVRIPGAFTTSPGASSDTSTFEQFGRATT